MADSDSDERPGQLYQNQPFDESLEVADSEEVASVYTPSPRIPASHNKTGDSPPTDHNNSRMMSGANSPDDDDIMTGGGPAGVDADVARMPPGGPPPGQGQGQMFEEDEDEDDDDESEDDDDDDEANEQIEGAYDPAEYEHLDVLSEIKELFQYITRYTPQSIELDYKMKPFIPDYIPAVGDIDAFIKVSRPDSKPEKIGLYVLDEPCAKQSDPTVLDLQLRAISKQTTHKAMTVRSIENAEKNPKNVDNWIRSISDLHRSKPPPTVHYTKNMPDIDSLMQEWPSELEELLKEVGLPTAELSADLPQYIDLVCALLEIPVHKSRIQSLHVLFTLFSEFKNSQHFKTLAYDNQLDNALKPGGGGDSKQF